MEGLIIKGIGGFYYVKTAVGVIQTRGRGKFKKKKITLMVGDYVDMEILDDGDGVINSIKPRMNCFDRPPIANVDKLVVVFSASDPKPNFNVIDKFLIMTEKHGVDAVLCMNKCDLVSESEIQAVINRYSAAYKVIPVSAESGQGIDELKSEVANHKCAFAGSSGVGKSTLTNILIPNADMETGVVSTKANRGKHTTRHVELFEVPGGGMLFDTPGFTSFDLSEIESIELSEYFPEFEAYRESCRFDDCRHLKEPDCGVTQAVAEGFINKERYDSYVKIFQELKELEERRY